MTDYLCISVTFLDERFHGRGDDGEPEWPPSPLRLMQAIVAANGDQIEDEGDVCRALKWLEGQTPPTMVAPPHVEEAAYRLSVPNNAMDLVAKAWAKGKYDGAGNANPAKHRTMKTVRPIRMLDGATMHYLWPLDDPGSAPLSALIRAAERTVALGWGIDLVVARANCISSPDLSSLSGERWRPAASTGPVRLRVPKPGTLQALRDRYNAYVHRIGPDGFVPVPPLTQFNTVGYRRPTDPVPRPHTVFELRHDDGSFFAYSQRKLIHIAGMMRHLAKTAMLASPPSETDENWVESYIVGHRNPHMREHRQLSYIPLPSIGHRHADHAVRRVMVVAPVGDHDWLEHLAQRLAGCRLKPEQDHPFGDKGPPILVRVPHDNVSDCYTQPAASWASVTPAILPGHDDRKPRKTRKLINKALRRAGVELPCAFQWSAFSRFPKACSAHKYGKDGRPQGHFRPDHLMTQTAVHLTLQFHEEANKDKPVAVPGPLVIGAGRHCGFGLMAAERES